MTSNKKQFNAAINKEKNRLEKLSKQLVKDRKIFDEERREFNKQKKDLSVSKRKLDTERKTFKNEQKKLKMDSKAMKRTRSPRVSNADGYENSVSGAYAAIAAASPWKSKYEKESNIRRQLQRELHDLHFRIKSLNKALKRSGRGSKNADKELLRKMKLMQKDLRIQRRKLRMAVLDMERTCAYYRKQMTGFKQKQTQWVTNQRTLVKKNHIVKYVWADDVKKIKLRRRGRGGGIRVWFKDSDEAVFLDVDILLPENVIDIEKAENSEDYDELLKEVRNDTSLDNEEEEEYKSSEDEVEEDEDVEDDDDDIAMGNTQSILPLLEELKARNKDILAMQSIALQSKYFVRSIIADDDEKDEIVNSVTFEDTKEDEVMKIEQLSVLDLKTEFVNKLIVEIKERHSTLNDMFQTLEEDDEEEDDDEEDVQNTAVIDENIEKLMENNIEWHTNLQLFPLDLFGIMAFELDDRIRDLQYIRNIGQQYTSFEELMIDVKKRHNCIFNEWNEKEIEKWENVVIEINKNNDRWRDQIQPEPEIKEDTPEPEITFNLWLFQNPIRNEFIEALNYNSSNEEMLAYIGRFLNRIIPTSDDLQPITLQHLYIPIMQENDPNMSLAKHVIMSCLDGVLLVTLINLVEPDFVDMRAMHIPDYRQPQPLNIEQIEDNIATVFSSARAMNLKIPHWTTDQYLDIENTLDIIVVVVYQLFNAMMNSKMNLKSHPELIRLCQSVPEKEEAPVWPAKEWMHRWLYFMNKPKIATIDLSGYHSSTKNLKLSMNATLINTKSHKTNTPQSIKSNSISEEDGIDDIKEEDRNSSKIQRILKSCDYHQQILMVVGKLDTSFNSDIIENKEDADFAVAQQIIKSVKHNIKAKTIVSIEDISCHNPLLQEMLLVDIFEFQNNIERISSSEKRRLVQFVKPRSNDDKSIIAWINSFNDLPLHVTSLERDVSDGVVILMLLSKCKPGCIQWKKQVRKKVRNRFDKLSNCHYVFQVIEQDFSFSLVGMSGSDIVDGNQKYIRTLLWQIMVFHATRLLSKMNFGGKAVGNTDLLKWCKHRLAMYHQILTVEYPVLHKQLTARKVLKKRIRSLKDPSLSDSIFYINMLASVHQKWINYNLVYAIPELPHKKNDKYRKQRIANARYCMTIIRRLGGELFVMVEDLYAVEQRAVLSMIAAIMTIAAKHTADDELILQHRKSMNSGSLANYASMHRNNNVSVSDNEDVEVNGDDEIPPIDGDTALIDDGLSGSAANYK